MVADAARSQHYNAGMVEIRRASLPTDLATVRAMFREYGDGLGID